MEFRLKTFFQASPEEIYSAWLNSAGHSAMTGGEAKITDAVGDVFSAWDGYIRGKNLILDPPNRIVQSWRTSEFSKGEADSRVEIVLEKQEEKTELTLVHTNLPTHGEQYRQGWEEHYFQPMKLYFAKKNN